MVVVLVVIVVVLVLVKAKSWQSKAKSRVVKEFEGGEQGCTAVGDGRVSPTTKVYEFWFFDHQSVQILFFLPPKCTNFRFLYRTVRILGRHVTSRTPLAVHPCI